MTTIQEFILKDVRCFKGEQHIQIRPITLLVGKNSTGKSTVLSSFQTLFDCFKNDRLNFNLEPYNMGAFADILCKKLENNQFTLGFKLAKNKEFIDCQIVFAEKGSKPVIVKVVLVFQSKERVASTLELIFKEKNKKNFINVIGDIKEITTNYFQINLDSSIAQDFPYIIRNLKRRKKIDSEIQLSESFLKFTKSMEDILDNLDFYYFFDNVISIAPIRSKPKRTYDPLTQAQDPEGADTPMYLATNLVCNLTNGKNYGDFMQNSPKEDARPIHHWLEKLNGKLIYSFEDKFSEMKSKAWQNRLLEYDKIGVAKSIPLEEWKAEQQNFKKKKLASNDSHILALAIASKTKLLYTADENLKQDFKKFIKQGRVYSSGKNKNLLTRDTCS